jgi:hypothetical protein
MSLWRPEAVRSSSSLLRLERPCFAGNDPWLYTLRFTLSRLFFRAGRVRHGHRARARMAAHLHRPGASCPLVSHPFPCTKADVHLSPARTNRTHISLPLRAYPTECCFSRTALPGPSVRARGERADAQLPSTRALLTPGAVEPPPPPSHTNWTRLLHPSVLIGHVSSTYPFVSSTTLPRLVREGARFAGREQGGRRGLRARPRGAPSRCSRKRGVPAPPPSY